MESAYQGMACCMMRPALTHEQALHLAGDGCSLRASLVEGAVACGSAPRPAIMLENQGAHHVEYSPLAAPVVDCCKGLHCLALGVC